MIAAVTMMHNEEDVAGYVVRHMLDECDLVMVADHKSDDGTRAILDAINDPRLVVRTESCRGYDQAGVMMRLVHAAMELEADWIVPFDADEWWYAKGGIRAALATIPAAQISTRTRTYNMVPQDDDPECADPFARVQHFRPNSANTPENRKIAFRPANDRSLMQGNHGLIGCPDPPEGELRIKHIPYRSLRQAKAKLRHGREALGQTNQPSWSGWHWRAWGAMDDLQFDRWWAEWTDRPGLVRWSA